MVKFSFLATSLAGTDRFGTLRWAIGGWIVLAWEATSFQLIIYPVPGDACQLNPAMQSQIIRETSEMTDL